MLEFAFVVTLLMMLLMGIVTFARAYNIYQSILRAAREGARVAVLPNCATCGNYFFGFPYGPRVRADEPKPASEAYPFPLQSLAGSKEYKLSLH